MSKQKKKRSRRYAGRDAASTPTVRHYVAEAKSPVREWWEMRKRSIKLIVGVVAGAIVLGWLLFELLGLVFG